MNNLKKLIVVLVLVLSQIVSGITSMAEDENIALGKAVTTNTSESSAKKIVDGNNSNATSANAWVVQANASDGAWASINLGGIFKVNKIKIYHGYSDGNNMMTDYDVYYSKSKSDVPSDLEYTLLQGFSELSKSQVVNEITIPVSARHIKIVSKTAGSLLRIREVEIYGAETEGEIPTATLTGEELVQSGEAFCLYANVKKNDYSINSVKLYINSKYSCDGVTDDDENYTFSISPLIDGEYNGYVCVEYGDGKSTNSNIFSFKARDLAANILINWISPEEGMVSSQEEICISAEVIEQNNTAVENVSIYLNDLLLQAFTKRDDNTYSVTKKLSPGEYTIKIMVKTTDEQSFGSERSIACPVGQITDLSGFTVSASSNGGDSSSTPNAVIDGISNSFTGANKWYINTNPDKAWLIIDFPCEYEISAIEMISGYTDKAADDPTAEIINDYAFSYGTDSDQWLLIDETKYTKEISSLTDEDLSRKFDISPIKTSRLKLTTGEICNKFRIREIKLYGYKINQIPRVVQKPFENNGIVLNTMDIQVDFSAVDDGIIEKTAIYVDDNLLEYEITENDGKYSATIPAGALLVGEHKINISATDDFGEIGQSDTLLINIVNESQLLDILSKATRETFEETFWFVTEYLGINIDSVKNLSGNKLQKVYPALLGKSFLDGDKLSAAIEKAASDANKEQVIVGGGGGGGGKSTSTGMGYAAPVITADVKNADDDIQVDWFLDIECVAWAKDAINSLYNEKIISGTDKNKFSPLEKVTRGQFVKMLVGALSITTDKTDNLFNDITKQSVYYDYVITAANSGIINGLGDGGFHEFDSITREAMAVMIFRALNYKGIEIKSDKSVAFSDEISDYAKKSVEALAGAGILTGVGDNEFQPLSSANRAMAAKVIFEIRKLMNN